MEKIRRHLLISAILLIIMSVLNLAQIGMRKVEVDKYKREIALLEKEKTAIDNHAEQMVTANDNLLKEVERLTNRVYELKTYGPDYGE